MGDSKTASNSFLWQSELLANLDPLVRYTIYSPAQLAQSGWTASSLEAATSGWLNTGTYEPTHILINIGVNDILNGTSQAVFEAKLGSILDKVHTKWPQARILVMRVWARGNDAACDTMDNTWIPNVLSTRSSFAAVGGDERIFLKGSDNGVTNTSDGIHPNAAGNLATATAWQAAMGY